MFYLSYYWFTFSTKFIFLLFIKSKFVPFISGLFKTTYRWYEFKYWIPLPWFLISFYIYFFKSHQLLWLSTTTVVMVHEVYFSLLNLNLLFVVVS